METPFLLFEFSNSIIGFYDFIGKRTFYLPLTVAERRAAAWNLAVWAVENQNRLLINWSWAVFYA